MKHRNIFYVNADPVQLQSVPVGAELNIEFFMRNQNYTEIGILDKQKIIEKLLLQFITILISRTRKNFAELQ